MIKIKDVETALNFFESAAWEHTKATENGDYKTGNKNYDIIVKAAAFLKDRGELQLVSKFLSHASAGVRIWAAAYILPIQEDRAVNELETIAKTSGILSLVAATTLSEWRKGNLKL